MSEAKMPLTGHLEELRKRIFISLVGVVVFFAVAFNYSEDLFQFLTLPLRSYLAFSIRYPYIMLMVKKVYPSLYFFAPAEGFWMHVKISALAGLVVTIPLILYQAWKFISPGLHANEKKYVLPFVLVGTTLFLMGAAFCFFIVLPFAMQFLLTYKTQSFTPMLSIGFYMDFALRFILAFGVIFELPVAIIVLARLGIVSPRGLAKKRKFAVLLAFVGAAILTPTPDAFTMILMALPIILLWEVGVFMARFVVKRKPQVA